MAMTTSTETETLSSVASTSQAAKARVTDETLYTSRIFPGEGSIRAGYFYESAVDSAPQIPDSPAPMLWPPGLRRLNPIHVEDSIFKVYDYASQGGETMHESIFRILKDGNAHWTFFGVFRITAAESDRPTVLVGLKQDHHTTATCQGVAAAILNELVQRECASDTDLLLISGEVEYAVDPLTVLPPGFEAADISTTLKPTPDLGCSLGSGVSSGSLGFWFSVAVPGEAPEILAVTCHHCISPDPDPVPLPPSPGCPPSGPVVDAPSHADRRLWEGALNRAIKVSANIGATTESHTNLLSLMHNYITPLGTVVCSSGTARKSARGAYLNWAVIRVDPSRVPSGVLNNTNMSDQTRKTLTSAWFRVVENEKDHMFKTGRTTGTTLGRPSPIDVDIRHTTMGQRLSFCSKDKAVLAINTPFAARGDSGALIQHVDADAFISPIGLLFGGCVDPSRPQNSPPVRHADPVATVSPTLVSSTLQNQSVQVPDLVFYTPLDDVVNDIQEKMSQVYGPDVQITYLN